MSILGIFVYVTKIVDLFSKHFTLNQLSPLWNNYQIMNIIKINRHDSSMYITNLRNYLKNMFLSAVGRKNQFI